MNRWLTSKTPRCGHASEPFSGRQLLAQDRSLTLTIEVSTTDPHPIVQLLEPIQVLDIRRRSDDCRWKCFTQSSSRRLPRHPVRRSSTRRRRSGGGGWVRGVADTSRGRVEVVTSGSYHRRAVGTRALRSSDVWPDRGPLLRDRREALELPPPTTLAATVRPAHTYAARYARDVADRNACMTPPVKDFHRDSSADYATGWG